MSRGIDNHIDWAVAATPHAEQYGPGLSRKSLSRKALPGKSLSGQNDGAVNAYQQLASKASTVPHTKRSVMEKLLGENNLAAFDAGGDDPYNATGKQFRR